MVLYNAYRCCWWVEDPPYESIVWCVYHIKEIATLNFVRLSMTVGDFVKFSGSLKGNMMNNNVNVAGQGQRFFIGLILPIVPLFIWYFICVKGKWNV